MKLSSVRIRNFRSFRDKTVSLSDYACFVGANGSGKSTVLLALNILFRDAKAPVSVALLQEEDFHLRNTSEPIRITAVFTDLTDESRTDFAHYIRQDQLVVIAEALWDKETQSAKVVQKGARLVMEEFAPFFEAAASGTLVNDLRNIYVDIQGKCPDLPNIGTKAGMTDALRSYEEANPDLCTLQESENQFYGWSKGANRLEKYCQWIYIPAVKDASEEQDEQKNSALGALLERTTRSAVNFRERLDQLRDSASTDYKNLLDDEQESLSEISTSIQNRLRSWSHPGANVNLLWHYDENKSVTITEPYARANIGEGSFLGEIIRLGHGMQRSFIVALLQELASQNGDDSPTLILGFEEPELYQHPPQAKYLASVIEDLCKTDAQVLVTTHSPHFITSSGFESVRVVRSTGAGPESNVFQLSTESLADKLSEALRNVPSSPTALMATIDQIMQPSKNEMYFCKIPILVEGPEDVALIATQFHLQGLDQKFRELGCHFVVCGGKSPMSRPLAIALGLEIPAFVVFDGDCDKQNQERDNGCILRLCGYDDPELPDQSIWKDRLVMWRSDIRRTVIDEIGEESWANLVEKCRMDHGMHSVSPKNGLLLANCISELSSNEIKIECLTNLVNSIVAWAESHAA